MKTPKRPDAPIIDEAEYDCFGIPTGDITTYWDVYYKAHARWKRKNREAQYKHTIAKLTRMLKNTEQCLLATQKMTGFGCFRPSHWENVFVNKEEKEEKKRLKTLKRLIRKLKPNDKP